MGTALILGYVSIALSFVSMCVAVLIAYRQGKIANRTLEIGMDTKSITEQFETARSLREKAGRLFPAKSGEEARDSYKYKIVYPVKYDSKPLPLINQGDFYAINSITIALGMDNVELQEIHDDGSDIGQYESEENTIFICSPQANPALNKELPFATIVKSGVSTAELSTTEYSCKEDDDIRKWLIDVELPCWFATVVSDKPEETRKTIQVYDKDDLDEVLDAPISSPADKCYLLSSHKTKKVQCGKVKDSGIFARITRNGKIYIVVAGIHQYGTWIVAHFLNSLIRETDISPDVKQLFQGTNDFIAIIRGEFVSKTLSVDWSKIDGQNLWVRASNGDWVRYDRVKSAEKHITKAQKKTAFSLRSKPTV